MGSQDKKGRGWAAQRHGQGRGLAPALLPWRVRRRQRRIDCSVLTARRSCSSRCGPSGSFDGGWRQPCGLTASRSLLLRSSGSPTRASRQLPSQRGRQPRRSSSSSAPWRTSCATSTTRSRLVRAAAREHTWSLTHRAVTHAAGDPGSRRSDARPARAARSSRGARGGERCEACLRSDSCWGLDASAAAKT